MQSEVKLLKVEAAAQVLSISRAKLWQIVRDGAIAVVRIDGCTRISTAAIERFIADCTDGGTAASARDAEQ